jgi:hypothetical protein
MSIFDELGNIPNLDGRCRGRWTIFDNDHGDPELTEYALNLCASCSALTSCESWFLSLKPCDRPQGVCAGRVWPPKTEPINTGRKPGRPRKERAA